MNFDVCRLFVLFHQSLDRDDKSIFVYKFRRAGIPIVTVFPYDCENPALGDDHWFVGRV